MAENNCNRHNEMKMDDDCGVGGRENGYDGEEGMNDYGAKGEKNDYDVEGERNDEEEEWVNERRWTVEGNKSAMLGMMESRE